MVGHWENDSADQKVVRLADTMVGRKVDQWGGSSAARTAEMLGCQRIRRRDMTMVCRWELLMG